MNNKEKIKKGSDTQNEMPVYLCRQIPVTNGSSNRKKGIFFQKGNNGKDTLKDTTIFEFQKITVKNIAATYPFWHVFILYNPILN